MDKKKKKKTGRPSRLSDRVIAQVEILAGLEHTEEEIAHILGVTALTIRRWKSNDAFYSALKRGKSLTDSKVTKSLVQRALGYTHKEIIREAQLDKIDANGKHHYKTAVTKIIEKKIPADTTAIIFWLKNRRRDLWRDKEVNINIEHKEFFKKIIAKPKLEKNRVEDYVNKN